MPLLTPTFNPLTQSLPHKPESGLSTPIAVFWACDRHLAYPVNQSLSNKYGDQLVCYTDMFNNPHTMFWDLVTPIKDSRKTVFVLVCKERGVVESAFALPGQASSGKEKTNAKEKEKVTLICSAPGIGGLMAEAVAVGKKHGVGHVALFDYDAMMVFSFSKKNPDGYTVRAIAPENVRKVLFEYLREACESGGLVKMASG